VMDAFDIPYYVARQGSAFCTYFMDHAPVDFHDILYHHDFELDRKFRGLMIEKGIFNFPLPIKQNSISYAHTSLDIEETLDKTKATLIQIFNNKNNF